MKEEEELNCQQIIKLREEEFQRIVQQIIMKKNPLKQSLNLLLNMLKMQLKQALRAKTVMALRKSGRDIEWHAKSLEMLDQISAKAEIEWIRRVQARYNESLKN